MLRPMNKLQLTLRTLSVLSLRYHCPLCIYRIITHSPSASDTYLSKRGTKHKKSI